jgi:Uma2 family endonuclease
MKLERWNALTSEQQQRFAPICPDFVVELRHLLTISSL